MGELFLILISTCLVNNLVLDFMLGVDPIIAVSKKHSPTFDMCILVIITMPFVAAVSNLINNSLLVPFGLGYLQLITTVLLVSIITLSTGIISKFYFPVLHNRIGVLIPLVIVNCTVLGLALLATRHELSMVDALFYGLGSALGFSFVLMAINSIRDKVSVSDVPFPFRGVAILLITLGLISMAFMGFNGIN